MNVYELRAVLYDSLAVVKAIHKGEAPEDNILTELIESIETVLNENRLPLEEREIYSLAQQYYHQVTNADLNFARAIERAHRISFTLQHLSHA